MGDADRPWIVLAQQRPSAICRPVEPTRFGAAHHQGPVTTAPAELIGRSRRGDPAGGVAALSARASLLLAQQCVGEPLDLLGAEPLASCQLRRQPAIAAAAGIARLQMGTSPASREMSRREQSQA